LARVGSLGAIDHARRHRKTSKTLILERPRQAGEKVETSIVSERIHYRIGPARTPSGSSRQLDRVNPRGRIKALAARRCVCEARRRRRCGKDRAQRRKSPPVYRQEVASGK
jgi:hypothetical protein